MSSIEDNAAACITIFEKQLQQADFSPGFLVVEASVKLTLETKR